MALPGVGEADPKRRDGPAAQDPRRVERHGRLDVGGAPGRAGACVARAVADQDDVCLQDVAGGQQARERADSLEVAAERLSDGDGATQEVRPPEFGDEPGQGHG